MSSPRSLQVMPVAQSLMAALEHGLLGRGRPDVGAALDECLARVGGGGWCACCGARMDGPSEMDGPVPPDQIGGGGCACCHGTGHFAGFVRLGRYEPPLDRLVRRVKEEAWHAMAREMGVRLGVRLRQALPAPPEGWIVIPIPADPLRRLRRGIDHAHAIAQGVALASSCRLVRALKVRHGARQAAMDRSRRWSRGGRFRLRSGAARHLRGRSVVLVDDVRTTGATLDYARELLRSVEVQAVWATVICVADRPQGSDETEFAIA